MKEEENIGEYLLRVDEVFNAIRGLGGKLKERSCEQGTKNVANEI